MGGYDPKKILPSTVQCDCSGFVAWCLGVSRKLVGNPYYANLNGGWFETSAVYRDARSPLGMVEEVSIPKPGDIIVWPDRPPNQGHIGIISRVNEAGHPTTVIHCSKGNQKEYGDAIQENDSLLFFNHGAICAKVAWVVEDA
jgi:hypothetical protein